MKKFTALFISFALLLALSACGSNTTPNATSAPDSQPSESESTITPQPESTNDATESTPAETASEPVSETEADPEPQSKSLVVYFSWSGNTRNVAESVQQQTGSDMFEIVPKTPYSTDYDTVVDDAKVEQQNNARPEIASGIENIDDYDTIYVGFPNWWGDMPMILYTFFDTYDLSGKTVALFCTSGGSGLSNTVNEVKELEPNANVTEGLHIGSGASSDPDNAVAQWLEKIGTVQ